MPLPAGIPILLRLRVTVSAVFIRVWARAETLVRQGELANEDLELSITREEMLARLPEQLVQEFEKEFVEVGDFGESISAAPAKQWGGLTALHFAVREGDLDAVKVLGGGRC